MASLKALNKGVLRDCCEYLVEELAPLGIYPVYCSREEASFKFADKRLGSLRAASVPSSKYSYRWNLYTGTNQPVESAYKTHWHPVEQAHKFVSRLRNYQKAILANNPESVETVPEVAPNEEVIPMSAYEQAPELEVTQEVTQELDQDMIDKYQDDPDYLNYLREQAQIGEI